MFEETFFQHYFYFDWIYRWQKFHEHKRWIFVDKIGEFSWTLFLILIKRVTLLSSNNLTLFVITIKKCPLEFTQKMSTKKHKKCTWEFTLRKRPLEFAHFEKKCPREVIVHKKSPSVTKLAFIFTFASNCSFMRDDSIAL